MHIQGSEGVFRAKLNTSAAQVFDCLAEAIRKQENVPVTHAMIHAAKGGKGMRGFVVMESARLFNVSRDQSIWVAAAVEAMHAYSLVHDDLPAMDDDALRRGQPTVHVQWDEATAILAGDALQALSFELLSRPEISADPAVQLRLISTMSQAAGAKGMVLGQAQDIAAETSVTPLSLSQITTLQANKTGALIAWSSVSGAILAGTDTAAMTKYAKALGLAFQIADDIIDVEGDPMKAGKKVGKDVAAGKATFVSLLGLAGAKTRARELIDQSIAALDDYGKSADTLRETARFAISREM